MFFLYRDLVYLEGSRIVAWSTESEPDCRDVVHVQVLVDGLYAFGHVWVSVDGFFLGFVNGIAGPGNKLKCQKFDVTIGTLGCQLKFVTRENNPLK